MGEYLPIIFFAAILPVACRIRQQADTYKRFTLFYFFSEVSFMKKNERYGNHLFISAIQPIH